MEKTIEITEKKFSLSLRKINTTKKKKGKSVIDC